MYPYIVIVNNLMLINVLVDANDLIYIIFAEASRNKEYEAFFDDSGKKLFR